jgi:hypothetical protein
MTLDNLLLDYADRIYKHSSDFTEDVIKRIPSELIHSIDGGKESFFEGFQEPLPKFYQVLMDNASPVYLIEKISFGMGLGNLGKEEKYYCWGFQCAGKLITAELPLIRAEWLKLKTNQKYLPCIPPEIYCFYQKTNGMAITNDKGASGYDLPIGFNDWEGVLQYCQDYQIEHNISMSVVDSLYNKFRNEDLRILIRGSLGDIIFLNFSAKDGKLYHVKNCDFLNYRLIEHAYQALDSYFANAVIGFPNNVDLR